jgi:D-alanyl-D-alanine carboxypeptidase
MGTNHVEVNLPRAPGLPACTYADVLTRPWTPATGDRALVDTELRLPRAYAPSDLVSVTRAGLTGRGQVRRSAINDLTAMARAARAAGARLAVQSAYRSYATQVATFNHWVSVDGYSRARRASARPGHSEHQLGTAIDFKSYGGGAPWSSADWGRTKAGTWLRTNAWEYGFVMSYPKAKRSLTCYTYEPWHFRYVGRAVAKSIHDSGETLREWLWTQSEESSR